MESIRFGSHRVYFAFKAMPVESITEGSDMYRCALGTRKRDPRVRTNVAEALHRSGPSGLTPDSARNIRAEWQHWWKGRITVALVFGRSP